MLRYEARQAVMSNFWGPCYKGDITSMSTNNPRSIDFAQYPNDTFNDGQLFIYAGTGIGQARIVSDFAQLNGEFTPASAFSPQAVAGDDFEVHMHGGPFVADYNAVIDMAYLELKDVCLQDKIDVTLMMERDRHVYPIPSGFRYLSDVSYEPVRMSSDRHWPAYKYEAQTALFTAATTNVKLSQAFKLAGDLWMSTGWLYLAIVGTIGTARTMTVRIETNSSGLPSGTLAHVNATSTLSTNNVPITFLFCPFALTAPIFLDGGTTYHIVLSISGSADASNYIAWGRSASTYANGSAGTYDASSWAAISNATFCFALGTGQTQQDWYHIPPVDWRVIPSSKYLEIDDPVDGRVLRLIGQSQPSLMTADTDTLSVPERFVIARASEILLSRYASGPQMDTSGMLQRAAWFKATADEAKRNLRKQIKPNSREVDLR